jgi:hypothetical protein
MQEESVYNNKNSSTKTTKKRLFAYASSRSGAVTTTLLDQLSSKFPENEVVKFKV